MFIKLVIFHSVIFGIELNFTCKKKKKNQNQNQSDLLFISYIKLFFVVFEHFPSEASVGFLFCDMWAFSSSFSIRMNFHAFSVATHLMAEYAKTSQRYTNTPKQHSYDPVRDSQNQLHRPTEIIFRSIILPRLIFISIFKPN